MFDHVKSTFESAYNKLTNPFTGTMITVWIVHNWHFVYSFFTFDADCTLNDRLIILESYITNAGICNLLWIPLFLTFVAIVFFLAFSALAKLIVEAYNSYVLPVIYKVTGGNKIVTREKFDENKVKFDSLTEKHANLFEERNELQDKYRKLEKERIEDEKKHLSEISEMYSTFYQEESIKSKKIIELENERDKLRDNYNDISDKYNIIKGYKPIVEYTLSSYFPGVWKISYLDTFGRIDVVEIIDFEQNKMNVHGNIINSFPCSNILFYEILKVLQFEYNPTLNPKKMMQNIKIELIKVNEEMYLGTTNNGDAIVLTKKTNQ